jgi:SAM domain (Sterile alpha motif)
LKAIGIALYPSNHSRQSSTTSNLSHTSSNASTSVSCVASQDSSTQSPTPSQGSIASGSSRAGIPPTDSVAARLRHHRLQKYTTILESLSFDHLATLSDEDLVQLGVAAKGSRGKLLRELATYKQQHLEPAENVEHKDAQEKEKGPDRMAPDRALSSSSPSSGSSKSSKAEYIGYFIGDPTSDTPPLIITKDSIEEPARRTPPGITLTAPAHKTTFEVESPAFSAPCKTASTAPAHKTTFSTDEIKPVTSSAAAQETVSGTNKMKPATLSKSPKKCRKSLKVQTSGAEFDLEKDKRPLSPFTSGGMLRRLLSHAPRSAPANITTFGPTVEDEVNGMLAEMESPPKAKLCMQRTTRAERGGGLLSKILGKRIGGG